MFKDGKLTIYSNSSYDLVIGQATFFPNNNDFISITPESIGNSNVTIISSGVAGMNKTSYFSFYVNKISNENIVISLPSNVDFKKSQILVLGLNLI